MIRERGPRKGRGLFAALLLASALCPATARATPEAYRVDARVHRGEGRVEGSMWVRVGVREGEDQLRLWLYPDRLAVAPAAMEERSWRWIYPGEVEHGGVVVHEVRVDGAPVEPAPVRRPIGHPRGRDTAGADLRVPIRAGPARTVELSLRFDLRVPGRFGRLGRADGLLSLAAPWYPLVVRGDAWAFDVPHRVEASLADEGELLLAGRPAGRAGVEERTAAYVPLMAAPRFFEDERRAGGVELVLRAPSRPYRPPPPVRRGEQGLLDLAHVDVGGLVEAVARDVFASARAFGVPVPERIVLVQIPSRTELVATAPGIVLFSDRLFQIFPLDQTRDFHRRALRRALFRHLAEPLGAIDPPADRGWATDLRAVVLVDLDEARRRSSAQTPQQLLGIFAFHPAVDQLLYAPQIAFEDTYFAAIEERDPFRDDPVRARAPLSSGRRILESARDALSAEQLSRFSAMLINARRPARGALREAAPERVARLPMWLAASGAPVNYRLGAVRSRRVASGFEHDVEVIREGAARAEPVEVEVHDTSGRRARGTWDAEGERGTVTVVTPGPVGGAMIDPRHRLPQSPELADGHPRIDDATDQPWRLPVLNAFLLDLFVTEQLFTGLVDFALRRRYDLEHTIGFRLERTASLTGGHVRYQHGLGPKVHTNRRMGFLGGGLSFERLHEGFGGAGLLGAWRGQVFLQGGLNTIAFSLDPREGVWLSARLVGGLAVRDDGSLGGTFRGGVRAGMVIPIGLVHAFALIGGGGFTSGGALASELQGLGGRAVLRGFESDELLGRGSLYLVAEHRFTALRDLAWNVAHLVWVREVQLVVFAGGGLVLGARNGDDVAGGLEAGGGLRFHYEYGGVQPGVVAIDVGVPLTRGDARVFSDGMFLRSRNPIGFYVSFDQYF